MKTKVKTLHLLVPLGLMLVLGGFIFFERLGVSVERVGEDLPLLPYEEVTTAPAEGQGEAPIAIVIDSENEIEQATQLVVRDTLDTMRLTWCMVDPRDTPIDFTAVKTILVATQKLDVLMDDVASLIEWVKGGGRIGFCLTPEQDSGFRVLQSMLGIVEYSPEYAEYHAYSYDTDLFPLYAGDVYSDDGNMTDFFLPVRLGPDCTVHLSTAGDSTLPIMWERPYGEGRIVMQNNTLMQDKPGRGITSATLMCLEDALIYPIVNAGMMFLDDFPAPQPEGYDERLLAEFGYDIQGFFRHYWWPQMKAVTYDLGVIYTGVLIETYNDLVEPPFEPEAEGELLRFYASELLHSGGEIGLHGYNHMSLNFEGFEYPDGVDYNLWPSEESMALALEELYRYGKGLFPDAAYRTYVPPSNFLSPEGQAVLLKTLPSVRVISGLYLRENNVDALVQEFGEEPDGSISVPRLTSGFILSDYSKMTMASELMFHGVLSHFIHPDDVLDEARGATAGWATMHDGYVQMLKKVKDTYPQLRFYNASDGAAAVQRFARLGVAREETETGLQIALTNFYDDAWLALTTSRPIAHVEGGEIYPVTGGQYWINAKEEKIVITWEAAE